ncbi:histidine kinase [Luteitalea sp. TBR-22]|uniref:hybrid sensor histidine kinase/response regulator n=1 Tax=Luteitalea sp. TBR-22 TaxID=2802971 RepID=UPI001AF84F30|nr:two-component regulator propeller domain-containing protein [Luteitalea sp. TBR-22]BCS34383.1 histidine kinase [Luteitalea sp. TBR-22]
MPASCRRLLLICLWLATGAVASAQPTARLIVDHWQVEDGLPQNTITSIAQDEQGYLWIATRKGLARFDGAQFTSPGRVGGIDLGNLRLTSVLPDENGALWVGTYGSGVLRIANGDVLRYGRAEGVPHDVVWDLSRDRLGRVWLASSRGARVFEGGRWQAPPLPPDLATDGVNGVYHARNGRLWLATSRHGLVAIAGDGTVRRYGPAEGVPSQVSSVAETPDGAIWAATSQGAIRMLDEQVTRFSTAEGLPVERVLQVLVDRRGVVWMATHGGGLVRYDGARFESVRRAEGLTSDYLIALTEDRDGALWVGTLSAGLNRLAPAARELLDTRAGLPPFPVTTVYQRGQTRHWWIGTYGGGLVSLLEGVVRVYTKADGLPSNAITTVAGGTGDSVWVGTNGAGAFRFENGRVVERVGPEVTGASLRTIEASRGVVWFGGNGLVRYEHGQMRRYGEADGLKSPEVRVIYAVNDRVWVGTYGGGLQSLEPDGRFVDYGEREGLTNPFVTSLHHDRSDVLWIGTYGGGLFALRNGRISGITTRDGLPDDVVFDVMEDNLGRLWLTGSQGLAVVRMADVHTRLDGRGGLLSVTQYGRAEGVPGSDGTDGNQPLSWLGTDGRLWFATVEGLVVFDPTEVADRPRAPTVGIDGVRVNQQTVPLTALSSPLRSRNLEVTYSAPYLVGGRAVQYEYRLSGLDNAWVDAGTSRVAAFTNLAPGEYHFEVRARARRGEPPGPVRTLTFTVPARFYETRWFLALATGLLALAIVGVVRWRLERLRADQQQLQRLVDERTAALRHEMLERERAERERRVLDERIQQAQRLESLGVLAGGVAHDFNNLLVGVLGEASLALAELATDAPGRPHVERIERAALRASELTSQMLAYSGRGRFIVLPVKLEGLVEEVRELLGSVIPRTVTVSLDFPRHLPLVAGDPSQLRQVVMNLITNASDAIGPAGGEIRISAGMRTLRPGEAATSHQPGALGLTPGDYVWLEVRDNGVGMDADTQARIFDPFFTTKPAGRGLGLAAVQGIVRSHGGRILVSSQPSVGTTFTLLFPCGRPTDETEPVVPPAAPHEAPTAPAAPVVAASEAPALHVLVVDDERLVRDVARVALRRAGYVVTEVPTGEDAVAAFDAQPDAFSLVVLDLTLPGIQGRAVLTHVRSQRPDLPIVLTSGYTAEEAGDLTAGPRTVFLQKPWRPEQLLRSVRELASEQAGAAADRG